jgi:hypothetical protein
MLTMVCLGPLAILPAIILGICAHRAIRKSGGTLSGGGMATAGILLGTVGVVLYSVLGVMAFRGDLGVAPKTAEAKGTEQWIVSGVKSYQVEYGKFPASLGDGKEVTLGADNNRLFDVLRARGAGEKENPRKVNFFDAKESSATPPKNGFGPDGVLYDPWGHPYQIRINLSREKAVSNPYKANAGADPVPEAVIVWSLGEDGQLGRGGDGDAKADAVSWE